MNTFLGSEHIGTTSNIFVSEHVGDEKNKKIHEYMKFLSIWHGADGEMTIDDVIHLKYEIPTECFKHIQSLLIREGFKRYVYNVSNQSYELKLRY